MDRKRFLTSRLRRLLETAAYAGLALLLLLAAAFIVFGVTGALWLLVSATLLIALGDNLPAGAILRVRRARPLAAHEAPALHRLVRELAARAELTRPPALYLVSRSQPEAFTVNSGGETAVAVSRGLLEVLTREELAGVLAHEVSHVRAGDTRWLTLMHAVHRLTGTLVLFGVAGVVLTLFLPLPPVSPFAPLLLVMPSASMALTLAVSRAREFDADLGAAALLGDPLPLARALHKLERVNGGLLGLLGVPLESLVPRSLRTHPPTAERVERLLSLVPPRPRAAGVPGGRWRPVRLRVSGASAS